MVSFNQWWTLFISTSSDKLTSTSLSSNNMDRDVVVVLVQFYEEWFHRGRLVEDVGSDEYKVGACLHSLVSSYCHCWVGVNNDRRYFSLLPAKELDLLTSTVKTPSSLIANVWSSMAARLVISAAIDCRLMPGMLLLRQGRIIKSLSLLLFDRSTTTTTTRKIVNGRSTSINYQPLTPGVESRGHW